MTTAELEHLFSLTNEYRSIKYDLRNMEALLERLGNPQHSFRSILIAGTNGKGSVAALLSAMMPEAGIYTSPHLQRVNERIRIGRQEISDEHLTEVHAEVSRAASDPKGLLYPPTYFEMMTAMAFLYFKGRTGFAILEVGMGGRLDATNVVRQDVSVITSIGLDHQEFLGKTLDQIAAEKAGIIKSKEPVVIGPDAEYDIIREIAGDRLFMTRSRHRDARPLGGGYFEFDLTTPIRHYKNLRPRLPGRHQIDNVVIAIRAAECLKLSREQIEHGVHTAEWPGRLETIPGQPPFLLDGAHNEAGVRALAAFLEEFYPQGVAMIFACMNEKDSEEMLRLLRPHVREAIFTRTQSSRSKDPSELQSLWAGSKTAPSAADAIQYARENHSHQTVLICGSLYLIGEAKRVLQ
jgi:dihydrofolate synthase/folylpolyglutamate synthase